MLKKISNILFPFYKSKEIKKIFNILEKNEATNKVVAMFVGGCVRKYILQEEIDDIDMATIFTTNELKEKFKNTEVRVLETGIKHGTVTLLINDSKFEITTLRKDIQTDGRHAEIKYTDSWEEDSKRRDFTINAIYLDKKGKIFDPQSGVIDLKNKDVNFIGEPTKRLEEDYLRIIRFLRFALQYDSVTDQKTIEALVVNLNGINNLSKERILDELFKIIQLKNFKNILKHKNKKNIFSLIFPELKYLDRIENISLLSNTKIFKLDLNLILAVLLIEKSNNHEYFCFKYKVSNLIKEDLDFFAKNYLSFQSDNNYFKKDLKKNIYLFGKIKIKRFVAFLFLTKKKFLEKELQKYLHEIESINIPKFPYNGNFLIKKGFKEGKKIGSIIKKLEEKWIENNYSLSEESVHSIIGKIK